MMSLLNQAAVEALCSATYLENYLDCVENMPDDLQRSVSEMRELDLRCNDHLKDIENYKVTYMNETDNNLRKRALIQIQRALIKCQEIGDEKLQLVAMVIEHIENRTRQLEQDLENLDPSVGKDNSVDREKESSVSTNNNGTNKKDKEEKTEKAGAKRQRRQRTHHDSVSKEDEKKEEKEKPKKKKKRKVKKEDKGEKSPAIDPPIDPDEPTYCLCDQVSYGEMIGCDNDDCVIEWFHFQCVGLNTKPKGKWYCPQCRGDKSNVRRQDK